MNWFNGILNNQPLIAAVIAWSLAQIIKVIRDTYKNKRFNYKIVTSSGGFPSSHSSSVVALATTVGMIDGFGSTTFAISFVFAMIVMYDAAGVRRAAGQQAEVINNFGDFLFKHGYEMDEKLKEILGHTPFQVFSGAVLGIIVGIFYSFTI